MSAPDVFENAVVQAFLNRAVERNIYVKDHHIVASPKLRQTFEWAIEVQTFDNNFLNSLHHQQCSQNKKLTNAQIAGAVNTYRKMYADHLVKTAQQALDEARSDLPQIPSATYAITSNEGNHIKTIRLVDVPEAWAKPKGTQIAQFQYGPDNHKDFKGFSFVYPGREIAAYKAYKGNKELIQALVVLMKADDAEWLKYGIAYAQIAKCCFRCGRKLTQSTSVYNALGPICAGYLGIDRAKPINPNQFKQAAPRVKGDELFDD